MDVVLNLLKRVFSVTRTKNEDSLPAQMAHGFILCVHIKRLFRVCKLWSHALPFYESKNLAILAFSEEPKLIEYTYIIGISKES